MIEVTRLPQSGPRSVRFSCHVKLLTRVRADSWNGAGFDGKIYRPGANLTDEEMGEHAIALEYAGPVGVWRRGKKREELWILWRWDAAAREWIEIARAQSLDWTWALVLREPAIRALHPNHFSQTGNMVDVAERGREVAAQLVASIDDALVPEPPEVRALVLCSLYDQMAGRIVAA